MIRAMNDHGLTCSECDRPGPPLDSLEWTEWEGGASVYHLGEDDPLMLADLVCPECEAETEDTTARPASV